MSAGSEERAAALLRTEPGVADKFGEELVVGISIAISLKRIADMMDAEARKPKPSHFEQIFGGKS